MKALIAIDPLEPSGQTFNRFSEAVGLFQEKGFFSRATIASIIHPTLYPMPHRWYRKMQGQLAKEAKIRIESACAGRFDVNDAKVFQSESPANEDLVVQLSRFGRRKGCDLVVVGSNNRKGLPHWILGGFAEAAALTSILPVLIVKPTWKDVSYSRQVRLLVTVDTAAPPSAGQIRWIAQLAKSADAVVDVLFVEPKRHFVLDLIRVPKRKDESAAVLKSIRASLRQYGVSASSRIIREGKSLAHSVARFAEAKKSWVVVAVDSKRSLSHRVLLGSTARKILSLTERPFLGLRGGR